jgi:Transposase DDE domain
METIVEHAQLLVYSLLALMPTVYQKDSFKAVMGLFLSPQGHSVPQHTQVKSAGSISRYLNRYSWSTRAVICTTRKSILEQIVQHYCHPRIPLHVIIDLTTLEKCGKFLQFSTPTEDPESPDPWVRILNGKRGLHIVVLYLELGNWRVPWSFRLWKGHNTTSPSLLACKLLTTVPRSLTRNRMVIVLADTEFGTVDFLNAVRKRKALGDRPWRAVTGMRCNRTLSDGRSLQQLHNNGKGKKGQLVYLNDMDYPVTVSWFWLKRADNKKELRFVVSTHPYSGVYLVKLGRNRWAIEGFFKTIKHRFGLHCFGQSTRLGVYRWLVLAIIAYHLTHWIDQWSWPPFLDWTAACTLALSTLFPSVIWVQLLKQIKLHADIVAKFGFEIILRRPPAWVY